MSKYAKIPYASLHTHSNYSDLDAISKIPDLIQRAVDFGWDSLSICDHGTVGGLPVFHEEANKRGVKPILGSELYFVPDAKPPHPDASKEEKSATNKNRRKRGHIVVMAMNYQGWINLQKLTTRANEQFYYKPIIGFNDLKEFNDGLIVLSGCLKNQINQAILDEKYKVAVRYIKKFREIFGDRFYLELQDGGLDIQLRVNPIIRRMGAKLGINVVATQDSHYLDRNDSEGHEGLWAIRTQQKFDQPTEGDIKRARGRCDDVFCSNKSHMHGKSLDECRVYYSTKEFWLKDAHHILNEPIINEYGEERTCDILPCELEMSAVIADRIESFEIKDGLHLPKYEFIPIELKEKENPQYEYLRILVKAGYERLYGPLSEMAQEHKDRLAKEMKDIKNADLSDYFLILWDIISWAGDNGIKTGVGRGSASGSIVAYCLGITKVEPLRYGLIWERFYNAGRKGSLADIDTDFPKARRGEVIDYIAERFGKDRVAQIGTWQSLGSKAALKDAARVLGNQGGMSPEDANVMTRFVPLKHNQPVDIKTAIETSDKIKEYSEKYPRLFAVAQKLEGCMRGRGTHAAGVVVWDKPFSEGFPLKWNTKEKRLDTEWDMETVESMGALKLDCLGVLALDVLQDIENEVNGGK